MEEGLLIIKEVAVRNNRPFNLAEMAIKVNAKVSSKTIVQKCIDALVQDSTLTEKLYNKQKIYSVNQAVYPATNPEELSVLDRAILSSNDKLNNLKSKVKSGSSQVYQLCNTASMEELQNQLQELTESEESLTLKLSKLTSNNVLIDPDVKKKVERCFEDSSAKCRKRKKWCSDLIDMVLEGYPKSKKEFIEELELEFDGSK